MAKIASGMLGNFSMGATTGKNPPLFSLGGFFIAKSRLEIFLSLIKNN